MALHHALDNPSVGTSPQRGAPGAAGAPVVVSGTVPSEDVDHTAVPAALPGQRGAAVAAAPAAAGHARGAAGGAGGAGVERGGALRCAGWPRRRRLRPTPRAVADLGNATLGRRRRARPEPVERPFALRLPLRGRAAPVRPPWRPRPRAACPSCSAACPSRRPRCSGVSAAPLGGATSFGSKPAIFSRGTRMRLALLDQPEVRLAGGAARSSPPGPTRPARPVRPMRCT